MNSFRHSPWIAFTSIACGVVIIATIGILWRATRDDSKARAQTGEPIERRSAFGKGNPEAAIQIVEYSDFECPACAYAAETLQVIHERYPNDVNIAFRHFPLSMHASARSAALAAEAAGAQGKFWEMHDRLFKNQQDWSGMEPTSRHGTFEEYAKAIGVPDIERFMRELDGATYNDVIVDDETQARELNLPGTPSIFINGKRIEQWSEENMVNEIERLLQEQRS